MSSAEQRINEAIAAQEIPGCVVVATNRDGSFTYSKSYGNSSMNPERAKPLTPNTPFWTASCTKLITSISALQLVDRGLLSLDESVYKHLPELEAFSVIASIDANGKPLEEKQRQPITLRMLLTHTSGLAYSFWSPTISAYLKYHGREASNTGTVVTRFDEPLLFQPGESFVYGPSIDYLGLLVERVSGQTLEEYMKEHIWGPLGAKDPTFKLSQHPDLEAKLADPSLRGEDGKAIYIPQKFYVDGEGKELEDCMGGMGLFATAEDYLKVLKMVLVDEAEEKFLKKATWDEFWTAQLKDAQVEAANKSLKEDMFHNIMGAPGKQIAYNWGLGGAMMMDDSPSGQKAGTMRWAGAPSLYWWVDRKAGLCGFYASQVFMPGDPGPAELNHAWEEDVYEMFAVGANAAP